MYAIMVVAGDGRHERGTTMLETIIGRTGGEVTERDDVARTIVLAVRWDLDVDELAAVSELDAMGWDVEVIWIED
jgi:hypothetical protein